MLRRVARARPVRHRAGRARRARSSSGGQPGAGPARHVVEPGGGPAEPPVAGRPVADHRVEGVDGTEADQPGHAARPRPTPGRPPRRRRCSRRPTRRRRGRSRPRPAPAGPGRTDAAAALARRVEVPGVQRRRRRPAPRGPARCRRARPRWRRRSARRDRGARRTRRSAARASPAAAPTAPPAHTRVQRAPAAVVPPQHALDGARGPPERGDRMPAAGIAEQQVAEEAGGGAVREDAVGTHRVQADRARRYVRTPRGSRRAVQGRWSSNGGRARHGGMSSLRVRALVRRDRRREFLAPGSRAPGLPAPEQAGRDLRLGSAPR